MRRFSSYGPVDKELHYYVPRQELINGAFQELLGDDPNKGITSQSGHLVKLAKPGSCNKSFQAFSKIPSLM
ncbi:hypothetical protein PN36_30730 [Candidatus Thiomargarita nelsonii]|uniref:Uncharacterized protein n=1 Tax=Candidatus Thiomargarita nelsonii TaxID=1003181 RepID=A0A4E0RLS2_9GAMM|nr:hypothetical protein PN36_30730 [Candidatus Thiomargarita nelsonii]